jgi:hypothetical protein
MQSPEAVQMDDNPTIRRTAKARLSFPLLSAIATTAAVFLQEEAFDHIYRLSV